MYVATTVAGIVLFCTSDHRTKVQIRNHSMQGCPVSYVY
jgi:2,3-bisphosphoglycerate-independent phosphoglycerate mutase